MYKVIIVEDEMFVRLGMKSMIEWEKYGMEIAGDFSNGAQALEYYMKESPDLVITDIKMPVMDGLTLIRKIREVSEETQIILLTCVEEFEMAKEAIRLNTLGYISKLSMKEDELEELVEKARQVLDRQNKNHSFAVSEGDKKAVKREILRRLVYDGIYDLEQIHNYIKNLELALNGRNLVLFRLHVDADGDKNHDGHLRQDGVMNFLEETVTRMCPGEVTSLSEDEYLLIFNLSDQMEQERCRQRIEELAENTSDAVRRYFNLSCFIGISSLWGDARTLPVKMEEALLALNQRFFMEPEIRYSWFEEKPDMESIRNLLAGILPEDESPLLKEEERVDFLLRFKEFNLSGGTFREEFLALLYELLQCMIRDSDMKLEDKQEMPLTVYRQLEKCSTFFDAVSCYHDAEERIRNVSGYQKGIRKEIIAARDFIEKNYDKNLSLSEAAESVNLSQAYFSTLFKKELGINFVEYLYGLRIEKAKEFLLRTDEAVYEISEKVGFKDQTYFSRIFKAKVGESPGEYRKKRTRS